MRWFACPICTRLARDRALCATCAEELFLRREPIVRDLGPYVIRSLFAWRRDDWPGLRWWATALKGKVAGAFWREPATWSLDHWGAPGPGTVFVPIPSVRPTNHARGFAAALAARCGGEVADVLRLARPTRQKRLDLFQRRQRRFTMVEASRPRDKMIVIDDIATTGATAEAAFRALGGPASCEIWCLVDRRPAREGQKLFDRGRDHRDPSDSK